MKMSDKFIASIAPPDPQPSETWWFIFSGFQLLVENTGQALRIPLAENPEEFGISIARRIYIGTLRGFSCYAAEIDTESEHPAGVSLLELRSLFDRIEDGFYEAALTAVHLIEWEKDSQYCSRCRGDLTPKTNERAKQCKQCGKLEFPRISPAIIVLVENGDTLLLARSARFPLPFFSVLAGFVEPGENLEAAVHREVMEETGIAVKDVRYFGSQPWPFPDSLMIAFTARYESGKIEIDDKEIVEAGWYRADNLPQIPGKLSIARRLIDWFIAKHSAE